MDLVLACFLNASGLSRAAQEYFKMFVVEGFRVIPVWLMDPETNGVNKEVVDHMISASGWPIDDDPVEIFVGLPHGLRAIKKRKTLLGSCVFENHLLTVAQARACRAMDGILTPSSFCQNTCLSSCMPRSKVHKVSYPLDFSRWNPAVKPMAERLGKFRFLFMNSLYERKGLDVLLRAWWNEFTDDDPVELTIKSYREEDRDFPAEAMVSMIASKVGANRKREARITILDDVMSDDDLPSFMKSFDCLVSPHRSEGFGMNPWYAMALGVPVICTNYGGVTDFAKDDTAWMVRLSGMSHPSPAEVRIFRHLDGITWAEPDAEHLMSVMRECVSDAYARMQRARNAFELVFGEYSPKAVMDQFKDALDKTSPGSWEGLNWTKAVERMASQPSPRYDPEKEIRMVEL